MPRLENADLVAAFGLVLAVQSAPDLTAYRREILRLRELVPCDAIGYNEVGLGTGETYAVLDPPDAAFPGVEEVFARYAHQHPIICHFQETGDPTPRALSDFLTADELHALDLYQHVYEPMGAEDQLSFTLPAPPEMTVGVALNRSTRGFPEHERELIELIRPHLGQAFGDARLREEANPLGAARLSALGLSPRQADVMRLLVDGRSAPQIAAELSISTSTARNHVAHIYEKLGVSSRGAAVAAVLRSGLDSAGT